MDGPTYGVIGILDRMREPSTGPGVAPPGAPSLRPAAAAGVAAFALDDRGLGFSRTRRRNCSLFMVSRELRSLDACAAVSMDRGSSADSFR